MNGFENVKLYDNRQTSKDAQQVRTYDRDRDIKIDLPIYGKPVLLYGNIMIVFKDSKMTGNSEIFRLSFNTAFIGEDNLIEIDRWQISPEDTHKDYQKFPVDRFFVKVEFEDFCHGNPKAKPLPKPPCRSEQTPLKYLCNECQRVMREEIIFWQRAQHILDSHDYPSVEQCRREIAPIS